MDLELLKQHIDERLTNLAKELNSAGGAGGQPIRDFSAASDKYWLAKIALTRAAAALGIQPRDYWMRNFGADLFEGAYSGWVPVNRTSFATQTTLTPELGGALVFPDFAALQIQEFLRPASVVRRHVSNVIVTESPYPMARVTDGTVVRPVGEGNPVGVTNLKFEIATITPKKIGGVVPLTAESVTSPRPGVLEMIQSDLASAMAAGQDLYLLMGSGTEHQPKGLLNWAGSSVAANTTINWQNVVQDLSKLRLELRKANIPQSRPVFFMSPRTEYFLQNLNNGVIYLFRDEMLGRKTVMGIPYEVTTQIPENLGSGSDESFIILADMAFAVIVDSGTVDVQVSREATFNDGSQLVSAFQNDLVLVRILSKVDLGVRHPKAVAVLTGVKWA